MAVLDAQARASTVAQWMRENRTYAHAARRLTDILAHWLHGPVEDQMRFLAETPEVEEAPAPVKVKQNGHHKKARVTA